MGFNKEWYLLGCCAVWLLRATQRNIPEDTILHSHRSENLKSYMALIKFGFVMS
jgi:hypothetical protein